MKKITLIMAFSIIAVSCSSKKENVAQQKQEQTETELSSKDLTSSVWILKELQGQAVELDKNFPAIPKLSFTKENNLTGNLGCNNFNSNYLMDNNALTIQQIASTQMACPNLEIEQNFVEILAKTKSFKIEKDILLLEDQNQEIIAKLKAE
ncbi:META domain-containing protein [Myroides sp. WP-1]|uniref:META domain-containing protein n=1 Tax=Myroides sp. WP-1 TaxID=2759944 RepID=UPI0021079605|nr:META domain-containing protein [Myroides sp. WP-1]